MDEEIMGSSFLGSIVNKPIWIINGRWLKEKIKELFRAFEQAELLKFIHHEIKNPAYPSQVNRYLTNCCIHM